MLLTNFHVPDAEIHNVLNKITFIHSILTDYFSCQAQQNGLLLLGVQSMIIGIPNHSNPRASSLVNKLLSLGLFIYIYIYISREREREMYTISFFLGSMAIQKHNLYILTVGLLDFTRAEWTNLYSWMSQPIVESLIRIIIGSGHVKSIFRHASKVTKLEVRSIWMCLGRWVPPTGTLSTSFVPK
jgi:hypothetical protein